MSRKLLLSALFTGATLFGSTVGMSHANATTQQHEYEEKATEFLKGFRERDLKKIMLHWSQDNPKYFVPYASGMLPESNVGIEQVRGFFSELPNFFKDVTLDIEEIVVDKEKRTVVARTSAKFIKNSDEVIYENNMVFFFRFDENGKFYEVSEYFNPIPTAVGFKKEGFTKILIKQLEPGKCDDSEKKNNEEKECDDEK